MKQKLKLIFVSLIFLLGLVLFLYPLANKYENKVEVEETKKNFEKTVEKLHEESNDEESPLNRLYSDMKAYNEKIYKDNQSDLKDPWSYQQSSFDLTQYGVEDNIIGYITVPHMEIELPIYLGANIKLNEEVAIKLEPTHTKHPQLFYESKLYMALQGGIGIPKLHWCGSQGNYNILIMDLLGHSLEDLFTYCKRKYTLLTTLMLVDQMLSRIEFIHSRNFIHRDVKPDNFLMGRGMKKHQVYAIDFGLAKRYRDPRTGLHIPYKDGKSLTGTARYASINTHLGIEQARRDDIEALGYILVYFMKGNLPWQGLKARNVKEKYEKIKEKKISTSLESLCQGLPDEFKTFIQYARDLKFEDRPDYSYLKNIIKKICEKHQLSFNYNKYDWILKREQAHEEQKEKEQNNKDKNKNNDNNEDKKKNSDDNKKKEHKDN